MSRLETILVLGRGELYFEPFTPGTKTGEGERYFGNTTTFQIARTLERQQRFTSYGGQKVEIEPLIVSESNSAQFITDNISIENIGLWYGKIFEKSDLPPRNVISENIVLRTDRYFQLGKTIQPFGVRNVESVKLYIGTDLVPAAGNYEVNKVSGRVYIFADSPVFQVPSLTRCEFEWRRTTVEQARSGATDIFGALRFVATNVVGPQRNYYFPYVRLSPRGQVDLKGEEWQQVPFDVTAMRLNPTAEQVYIDGSAIVGLTADEEALVAANVNLDTFPALESMFDMTLNDLLFGSIFAVAGADNELNIIINTSIPLANFGQPIIYP